VSPRHQEARLSSARVHWGLVRSVRFDVCLVLGAAGLALLSGVLVAGRPALFGTVLLLDLWLLSYHHVIATFTRLGFDAASRREHRFLILVLPPIIAAATITAVITLGTWIVPTVYFHFQWWHYTRQSYGISRIYQLKTAAPGRDRLGTTMLYLVALAGIVHRSAQGWTRFLGLELRMFPAPRWLADVLLAAAAIAVLLWLAAQGLAVLRGRFEAAYALYLGSHLAVFVLGYLAIPSLDVGWLIVNVWHNAQYLLLVWLANNNRFKGGPSPDHRWLSWLSQDGRAPLYVLACLGVTTLVYGTIDAVVRTLALSTLPVLLIAYQTINFHHYLVDGRIWKLRRKPLRETLEIRS
jgi:hypothetical protein